MEKIVFFLCTILVVLFVLVFKIDVSNFTHQPLSTYLIGLLMFIFIGIILYSSLRPKDTIENKSYFSLKPTDTRKNKSYSSGNSNFDDDRSKLRRRSDAVDDSINLFIAASLMSSENSSTNSSGEDHNSSDSRSDCGGNDSCDDDGCD